MDTERGVFQEPEEESRERREQEYQKAVQATEELYQMSIGTERDDEKINELCKVIGSIHAFQDHLVEGGMGTWQDGKYVEAPYKATPQFFETLVLLNKMARIHENFSAHNQFFLSSEAMEVSKWARIIIMRILDVADEKMLNELDDMKINDFFDSLKLILTSTSDGDIEKAINFLDQHKELFTKLSQTKNLPAIENRAEELRQFLTTREFERVLVDAVQDGIHNRRRINTGSNAHIQHLGGRLKDMIAKYGLDPDEIIDVWNGSYTENGPQPSIRSNMNMVFVLEDERPGIARVLYEKFGIRNFERYPESVLQAQFDERDNTEKPYGVMLQATHDWNGAFGHGSLGGSDRQIWEKLFRQIKARYALRIVEAKNKVEVARRLIGLNKTYGKHHKIAFALIGGHGTKDHITLGGTHRKNMILFEDLAGKAAQRTGGFFAPNPTIVLASCSTGAEGGIGQELSKVLGAKVIAPKVPSGIKNIDAIISDDGIDFDVEYRSRDKQNDISKVYSAGEMI